MHTRKIDFKGGYGEHGRNCFLITYGERGRYYLVDCGIMDEDSFPYPRLERKEVEKIDYLLLSHCHKDHSGALSYLFQLGFHGTIVTSAMTAKLLSLSYEKMILLDMNGPHRKKLSDELQVSFGRAGHCPGGLWFFVEDLQGTCFFSGDYQRDSLVYGCDCAERIQADIAVVDCAHCETQARAAKLRDHLTEQIAQYLQEKRRVILPVPAYGRGLELLYLLMQAFPDAGIYLDAAFLAYSKRMLQELVWYQPNAVEALRAKLGQKVPDLSECQILLLADTHLKKTENKQLVQEMIDAGAVLLITGRVKKGSFPQQLLREKKAKRFLFPHHQSAGDFFDMMECNDFFVVYPFHNDRKEIFINGLQRGKTGAT